MSEVPELEAHKQGKDVLLTFQKDVSFVLSDASDYYSEAIILGKAANILQRHMLNHKSKFCGTYHEGCIQQAIPPTLLQFVAMLEHGADIESQLRFGASKTDVAIAQLLQYNSHAKYKEGAPTHRHSKDRERPLSLSTSGCLSTHKPDKEHWWKSLMSMASVFHMTECLRYLHS